MKSRSSIVIHKIKESIVLHTYGWICPECESYPRKPFKWRSGYGRRITHWQKRELATCNLTLNSNKPKVPTMWAMLKAQWKVLRTINYTKEKGDIWSTSSEVRLRNSGDCEDQAFLIMALLRDECTDWDKLGICIVKGHAFATVQIDKDDFWVIDNGHLSYSIKRASLLLPFRETQPICGFNLFKKWSY